MLGAFPRVQMGSERTWRDRQRLGPILQCDSIRCWRWQQTCGLCDPQTIARLDVPTVLLDARMRDEACIKKDPETRTQDQEEKIPKLQRVDSEGFYRVDRALSDTEAHHDNLKCSMQQRSSDSARVRLTILFTWMQVTSSMCMLMTKSSRSSNLERYGWQTETKVIGKESSLH